MREYHKWLLSASPKCKLPRLSDHANLPPGYKYLSDRQSAKLIACLRAAIVYVNLKHEKRRARSVSEERCASECK